MKVLVPAAEAVVAGDRDGGLLFSFGEALEQQLGAALVEFHSTLGGVLGQYRVWMIQGHGLTAMTVLPYESTARRFRRETTAGTSTIDEYIQAGCSRRPAGGYAVQPQLSERTGW